MLSRLIFIFVVSLGLGRARAVDYYIAPDGHDNAEGRSPAHAWKSLAQVWGASLKGGDQVLLKRGGVWHETLTVPSDGATDHPIVIGAYGNGDLPCIDGGDLIDANQCKPSGATGVFVTPVDHKIINVWDASGSLEDVKSIAEVDQKPSSFFNDGQLLYIHPYNGRDPRMGQVHFEIPKRDVCVEISKSHIALHSIAVCHAAGIDRGAITVWADHELAGIEMRDCDISNNCGRGVWLCGPANSAIHGVLIEHNVIRDNDGSGLSLTLTDGGQIDRNAFSHNCRRELEAWQAGIRLWSSGIRNLDIHDNTIADERWMHGHDCAMGIHCDETADHVVLSSNQIKNVDHAGIEVENCRGVMVEKNVVTDCNIGIFINRAGHDHIIRDNTVTNCRSQGLAIQGWLAHGVDAQPEILVEGRLLTRNLFENNRSTGSHYANLKANAGGEQIDAALGNIYRNNDLGPEKVGFIEWGDRILDRYDQWPAHGGGSH